MLLVSPCVPQTCLVLFYSIYFRGWKSSHEYELIAFNGRFQDRKLHCPKERCSRTQWALSQEHTHHTWQPGEGGSDGFRYCKPPQRRNPRTRPFGFILIDQYRPISLRVILVYPQLRWIVGDVGRLRHHQVIEATQFDSSLSSPSLPPHRACGVVSRSLREPLQLDRIRRCQTQTFRIITILFGQYATGINARYKQWIPHQIRH